MRLAALAAVVALTGCTASSTERQRLEVLACPVIDTSALRRCEEPVPLPADPGEAVLALWYALRLCVDAARDAVAQIERASLAR